MPPRVQHEVIKIRDYIRSIDPQARIKLIGSWTRGTWADEHTSAFLRHMRLAVKRKPGLSDIDLVIDSSFPFKAKELQPFAATTRIDIWLLNYDRLTGLEL
jgi:hypothetical protein